jgi:hypothetical protein
MPTLPRSYQAVAVLAAYVHVMRNAPILYAPLAQRGESPPPVRRLEEAAAGVLAAWVRARTKMYGRLRDALAEEGDPQEVLRQELAGAVLAELATLKICQSAYAHCRTYALHTRLLYWLLWC